MDKKIAIINSVYNIGSTGHICFDLSNFFISKGFDVCTFYGRNNQKLPNSYYFGNKMNLIFHAIMTRITDRHGLFSSLITNKLIKVLKKYQADIYILHNLHGYYINYEILLSFLHIANKPVIWVFHDCWNITGHCAHFSFAKCNHWEDGCYHCSNKRLYPSSYFLSNSNNNFITKKTLISKLNNLCIVAPSRWLLNLLELSYLKEKAKILINNGIDHTIYKKNNKPSFKKERSLVDKKLILCVAYKFTKQKGLDDIIKLSSIIDSDTVIVMVGDSSGIRLLPSNILAIGKTNNVEELVDIYSSCDVFFNPTYEDTYPSVNLEAISCGLPVICYKTCGATEMIDPRFAVNQGDFIAAYDLMKKLFNSTIYYDFSLGSNISKESMFKKYLSLVVSMI